MIVAVLQARTSSSRLPGKVLAEIAGVPMLLRQIERIRRSRRIDSLIIATSAESDDDRLAELCEKNGITCHRGSLNDVLDRVIGAVRASEASWVVRLTGDCPLTDPEVIDRVIAAAVDEPNVDYATNALEPTYPDGLDVEIVSREALETAWREATLPSEREHVTPFITSRPERFRKSPKPF